MPDMERQRVQARGAPPAAVPAARMFPACLVSVHGAAHAFWAVKHAGGVRAGGARVEELGGRLRIERAPVQGTRLVIELPGSALALAKG